jgi:hypothetical protein
VNTPELDRVPTNDLLRLSQRELDQLFTGSPAGDIPDGKAVGTAIIAPGTGLTLGIAGVIRRFAWQGKVFDAAGRRLQNLVSPFGIRAVVANVYKAASLFDGKECIVLDYSRTSLVAHFIRDELRQIGPGLYLGKAFLRKRHLLDFVLRF